MLQVVSVTFDELSLENETCCGYDSVSLYDGLSSNELWLGTFCTHENRTVTSSGSTVFVVFRTDKDTNEGCFSLSWTFVNPGDQGLFVTNIC